jgi:nicotinate phosphoribosyltransferase
VEFGLRRPHGKGANAGTRAALIGGANYSSNVGTSHVMGLLPKGTHAHSMVQLFLALGMGELEAFQAYADLYPDDCLLLVDTIDTLSSGIPNAIKVFDDLRKRDYTPVGIRLDSGDLAYLSIQAARMLDEAGFPDTAITLSNDLDEMIIWRIINQIEEEAPQYGVDPDRLLGRLVYGVGTRLITSHGDPALGGVYKLVAVCKDGSWLPAMKISESTSKIPNPGRKLLWRIYDKQGMANADLISLYDEDPRHYDQLHLHHLTDHTKSRIISKDELSRIEFLLMDVMREGKIVCELPNIEELRRRRQADVEYLDPGVRRIIDPQIYHVSLTQSLWDLKQDLIKNASGNSVN